MPSFAFTARDRHGQPQRGVLEAASTAAAVNDLRERGWLVLDVRDATPAPVRTDVLTLLSPRQWLPARSVDVEFSLRQMALMLRSGLTLLSALNTVAEQADRPAMRRIWSDVAGRIQEGASLAEAMSRHSRFAVLVIQLVRVGEQTGQLEPVLTRAAATLEHRRHLRTSILTALAYPTVVLLAAVGVAAFMTFNVIPKLERFLSAIGRRLPAMTQLLLDISRFAQAYVLHVLLGLAVTVAVVIAVYFWPQGRLWIDRAILRVPLAGKVLRLAATVSFANGLSALLHSGITLLEGLRTVERLLPNRYLAVQVATARDAVMHGGNLAEPLARRYAFMPMLSRMVAVGESAGTLDEVLDETARFYEAQLQSTIRQFSVIVEPIIILVVGGIVGFVYVAFFLALFAAGGVR
jgi:type II secretory pathway component PulF